MRERVKVFTHSSGEGSTVSEDALEEMVNDWLAGQGGQISHITQSESHRPGKAQHVTLCIWYVPAS
jgi:hypothetical protein